jgi:16S rRNA (guanine(527)-N(7))-methyltransferase RsmG
MVITSEEKKAFFSSLSEAFPHLSQITIERLYIFCELLVRYNDEYDLSRLKKFSDIIIKHFIDSIIVGTLIELPESLLDIGTGAGFPGIPLKIVHPDLKLILAEPRPMRVKFMNMVIKELSLSCVSVFSHKVNEKMYFPVSGVITRAFESTPATLEICVYFLPHNGSIILLKGPGVDAEMEEIPKEISDHYHLKTDLPYKLPKTSHERRLLVYKKTSSLIKRFYQISELPELTVGITIESSDNKRYKELKKAILTGPGKSRLAVISGEKTITDNYQIIRDTIFCGVIYDGYCEKSSKQNSIIAELDRSGKLILLKKSLYNELDIGINRQLLLFKKINDFNCLENIDISRPILLVPFQDPANTGSVIR